MANQFVNLPTPSTNGVGTAVDTSTFGSFKTIVVAGNLSAIITIEINNDPAQSGAWAPIWTFAIPGEKTLQVASMWMRTRVSSYNPYAGGTPQVDLGGTDDGTGFVALPVPAGNGVGAAVSTSGLGLFHTAQVGGDFRGTLLIEASEDGTTTWATVFSGFQNPAAINAVFTSEWLRVRRVGVPAVSPGLPIVNIGATSDTGGGGGGGSGNPMRFVYTASGAEGSDFTVPLPVARATDLYNVLATTQGVAMIFGIDLPDVLAGDRTTTGFRVVLTAAIQAGDRVYFEAADPT